MTELLLLGLIIVLTGSFFSLQKKLNPFVLPADADRASPKTNNAWFATTCAGYASISETVEVVYHQKEKMQTGKSYLRPANPETLNGLPADNNSITT